MAEGEGRAQSGARTEDAHIRTFLIADVRGYTAFTQEHGDEAAARLAGRFAEIAREGVEAHDGEVVELRGDEALNLAARLCAQARRGEVLASQGVAHLARAVDGIRLPEHGVVELKGLS